MQHARGRPLRFEIDSAHEEKCALSLKPNTDSAQLISLNLIPLFVHD